MKKSKKIEFILVFPLTKTDQNTGLRAYIEANQKAIDAYRGRRSYKKAPTQEDTSSPFHFDRFGVYRNATDKTAELLKSTGFSDLLKLKRYKKSKNRCTPKELRIRLGKEVNILFTGTTKSIEDLDSFKVALSLQGIEHFRIIDCSSAEPASIKEI